MCVHCIYCPHTSLWLSIVYRLRNWGLVVTWLAWAPKPGKPSTSDLIPSLSFVLWQICCTVLLGHLLTQLHPAQVWMLPAGPGHYWDLGISNLLWRMKQFLITMMKELPCHKIWEQREFQRRGARPAQGTKPSRELGWGTGKDYSWQMCGVQGHWVYEESGIRRQHQPGIQSQKGKASRWSWKRGQDKELHENTAGWLGRV